jgi:hypothetical protein
LTLLPSVTHTLMVALMVSRPLPLGTFWTMDTHQSTQTMLSFASMTLSASIQRSWLLGLILVINKAGRPLTLSLKRPYPPSFPNSRGFRLMSWLCGMIICRKFLLSISYP